MKKPFFCILFLVALCLSQKITYAASSIDYVILTNKTLAPAFASLAAYKNSQGFKTSVFYIENIPNYPGVTLPQEKIRTYIMNLRLKYPFRYLLIGGDFNVVPPSFYYHSYNLSGANNVSIDIPTDAYYGLLTPAKLPYTGGNLQIPKTLSFSVVVGRAPVRTIQQASAFVSKTISYSTNIRNFRLNRNVIIGEMLTSTPVPNGFPPSQLDFASKYLSYDVGNGLGSVESNTPLHDTFYEFAQDMGSGRWNISLFKPQTEASAVNTTIPRHVAIYYGHDNSYVTMKHLRQLTTAPSPLLPDELSRISQGTLNWEPNIINNHTPDIIFNMGCSTAAYDHQDPLRSSVLQSKGLLTAQLKAAMLTYPSIGEEFILNSSSRTIAYIGNSRPGIGSTAFSTNPSAILLHKLVYQTFKVPGNRTLGNAFAAAMESYANVNSRLVPIQSTTGIDDSSLSQFYNVNLLGDPTTPL